MHIGLIGGIGPAATDLYYRRLIAAAAAQETTLELTIAHADAPTLLRNQARDEQSAQVEIFLRLAEQLQAAGAQTIAVPSIAGHFCIGPFKATSPLPVIDMLEETEAALARSGFKKVGILGTQGAMESRLYGAIESVEILPPPGSGLMEVHEAYVAMATAGAVTAAQRETFLRTSRRMIADHGAEAIILGGTDLALVFDGQDHGFQTLDCADVHIETIARLITA